MFKELTDSLGLIALFSIWLAINFGPGMLLAIPLACVIIYVFFGA